jgi:hypothetical protein
MSLDFSKVSRETEKTPYRLGPKRCTTCKLTKPRIAFTKYGDGRYSDRCFACKQEGKRAKPVKGGRRS